MGGEALDLSEWTITNYNSTTDMRMARVTRGMFKVYDESVIC